MFASIRGWPAAKPTVDSLRDQVAAAGGEIVVMDGSGNPTPSAEDTGAVVRWVKHPGWSVFQLRHAGYGEARGEIVAVTEDHCRATPDWCEAILRAHVDHPDAIAIGGCSQNGTTSHVVDWAAFIVVQGPFIAPLPNGPADRIAGAATVSYKRRALERFPDHGPLGAIELFDTATVRRDGETLINDDRIRIIHHQSMGIMGTAAAEYHNGRTIAGFRRRMFERGDLLRIVGFPVLALYRSLRSIRIALGKRVPRAALITAIPSIVFLQYAHGAGELLGYLAGPGDSPRRLL
jgi:glycosyl transferase family 2